MPVVSVGVGEVDMCGEGVCVDRAGGGAVLVGRHGGIIDAALLEEGSHVGGRGCGAG